MRHKLNTARTNKYFFIQISKKRTVRSIQYAVHNIQNMSEMTIHDLQDCKKQVGTDSNMHFSYTFTKMFFFIII